MLVPDGGIGTKAKPDNFSVSREISFVLSHVRNARTFSFAGALLQYRHLPLFVCYCCCGRTNTLSYVLRTTQHSVHTWPSPLTTPERGDPPLLLHTHTTHFLTLNRAIFRNQPHAHKKAILPLQLIFPPLYYVRSTYNSDTFISFNFARSKATLEQQPRTHKLLRAEAGSAKIKIAHFELRGPVNSQKHELRVERAASGNCSS